MICEKTLSEWAIELGFCKAALCSADGFADEKRIVDAQTALPERKQLRFDPEADDPRIRSLCVLLWLYPEAVAPTGDHVFVDSYYFASNAAYHAARELEAKLRNFGHYACANVSYPAKRAAIRAGFGVLGMNDLLITPEYGSRVVIILMSTDLEAECPDQKEKKRCLQCGRCRISCPSGALGANGMEHPERCLRNYTMEGVVVPEEVRKQIGMRLIGCDMCQRVCPMQTHASNFSGEQPVFSLNEFITEDSAAFSASTARLAKIIGRNAARPQRIRAQAALLAGNQRKKEYLPVLRNWIYSEFEAVRTHALWAIEQIEAEK